MEGELAPKEMVSNVMMSVSSQDCLWKLLEKTRSLRSLHRILALVLRWRSISTLSECGKQQLTAMEIRKAKLMWTLWVQQEMLVDLELSVDSNVGLTGGRTRKPRQKVVGKY